MSPTVTRKLEIASNIAVLVAAIFVCVAVVRSHLYSNGPPPRAKLEGQTIDLTGITPTPGRTNILLALSQTCRFCEQQMPLYREIGELASKAHTRVYAVFPAGQGEARRYLDARSVRTDGVVSYEFQKLGVQGTPTLLVVDAHGRIQRAWVGMLTQRQEQDVLRVVQHGS